MAAALLRAAAPLLLVALLARAAGPACPVNATRFGACRRERRLRVTAARTKHNVDAVEAPKNAIGRRRDGGKRLVPRGHCIPQQRTDVLEMIDRPASALPVSLKVATLKVAVHGARDAAMLNAQRSDAC